MTKAELSDDDSADDEDDDDKNSQSRTSRTSSELIDSEQYAVHIEAPSGSTPARPLEKEMSVLDNIYLVSLIIALFAFYFILRRAEAAI